MTLWNHPPRPGVLAAAVRARTASVRLAFRQVAHVHSFSGRIKRAAPGRGAGRTSPKRSPEAMRELEHHHHRQEAEADQVPRSHSSRTACSAGRNRTNPDDGALQRAHSAHQDDEVENALQFTLERGVRRDAQVYPGSMSAPARPAPKAASGKERPSFTGDVDALAFRAISLSRRARNASPCRERRTRVGQGQRSGGASEAEPEVHRLAGRAGIPAQRGEAGAGAGRRRAETLAIESGTPPRSTQVPMAKYPPCKRNAIRRPARRRRARPTPRAVTQQGTDSCCAVIAQHQTERSRRAREGLLSDIETSRHSPQAGSTSKPR